MFERYWPLRIPVALSWDLLCGSIMRLWEFDRIGGIASVLFDINKDGARFVSVVLAFLWMDKEQLGFDSTIVESNG